MREEVEAVIEAEGWTKLSMGKMRKVDSFIRESQRLSIGAGEHIALLTIYVITNKSIMSVTMRRKVVKDFTFSNGMTLPAGTHFAVATYATHMDPVSSSLGTLSMPQYLSSSKANLRGSPSIQRVQVRRNEGRRRKHKASNRFSQPRLLGVWSWASRLVYQPVPSRYSAELIVSSLFLTALVVSSQRTSSRPCSHTY